MPKATLSVIMPNYNHSEYLPECLTSLVSQTRLPDEIIIIDDGSTDNSVEIIQSFAAKCPAIKFHSNDKNRGVVYTSDRGLHMATGQYVYFASADDRTCPTLMEKSMDIVERYPQAALSCSEPSTFDGETGILSENRMHWSDTPRYFTPDEFAGVLAGRHISGNTGVFKKDLVFRAGGYHPELRWHIDYFLGLVLAFRHGICYIPESLAHLRVLQSSYSAVGMKDPARQFTVIKHLFRLLKMDIYRDLLPYFAKSSALKAVGPLLVPAYLSDPEHWDPITQSLLVEPMAEWGIGKAMEYGRKGVEIHNENQWRHAMEAAKSYSAKGQLREVRAILGSLLQQNPGLGVAHEMLALTAHATGDEEQAVKSAREAIRLSPLDEALKARLSIITSPETHGEKSLERPGEARSSRIVEKGSAYGAKPAEAASGKSFQAEIKAGLEKQRVRDFHGALAVYGKILDLEPGNLEALHLMGIIGIQIRDFEVARELLSKAAAIDPAIPLFYRMLDEDFKQPGLYAETLRCFRSVVPSMDVPQG